ncbi:ZIP-like iron-zinc transporter [Mycena floridula]|nr:ZIP-like iron-zinc transporter [Mycena floridula]
MRFNITRGGFDLRETVECGFPQDGQSYFALRVASVFIILFTSTLGAIFPILAKRSRWVNAPKAVFQFVKYFGSGVIVRLQIRVSVSPYLALQIATAFIHLLSPALTTLGSQCLPKDWSAFPYAIVLCLFSIFSIFIIELVAFRWGTTKLAQARISNEVLTLTEPGPSKPYYNSNITQITGVAVLEIGVALHKHVSLSSVLIGLTLAVDQKFKILFIVLVFHQTFEGLGIGTRLACMDVPAYVPFWGAIIYGLTTPVGIAVGLGVKKFYNPNTFTASIVSGVLDSLSSGILIYTGLVELLAHEFLFDNEMMEASNGKVLFAVSSMLLGCVLMSLLGKWA